MCTQIRSTCTYLVLLVQFLNASTRWFAPFPLLVNSLTSILLFFSWVALTIVTHIIWVTSQAFVHVCACIHANHWNLINEMLGYNRWIILPALFWRSWTFLFFFHFLHRIIFIIELRHDNNRKKDKYNRITWRSMIWYISLCINW